MSENDSQLPQDPGNAGDTQQQPRVQVESTPADGNIPYVQAYDTQTGKPLGGQQVVNKHTVVKTKTKKLPIFITALAGCACGALLVIALIMSGTLDIGGGRNAVTAGASGSSAQKITIDSEDTTLAEAVSAKALPSVVSITATSSGSQNGSLSQSADESDSSGSVGSGVVLDTEGHILTNNHVVDGYDQYVVTMDDGTTYEAEFVGNDASSDLPSSSSRTPTPPSLRRSKLATPPSSTLASGLWRSARRSATSSLSPRVSCRRSIVPRP